VVLILISIGSGTIGIAAGSGLCNWSYNWKKGGWGAPHSKSMWIGLSTNRVILLQYSEFLDNPPAPTNIKIQGPGWHYHYSVQQPLSLYSQSRTLTISFIVPLIISLLSTIYPTIAILRGPLRRYRRRRKGLCVKCGYNLTGNKSGVCPECGTEIKP